MHSRSPLRQLMSAFTCMHLREHICICVRLCVLVSVCMHLLHLHTENKCLDTFRCNWISVSGHAFSSRTFGMYHPKIGGTHKLLQLLTDRRNNLHNELKFSYRKLLSPGSSYTDPRSNFVCVCVCVCGGVCGGQKFHVTPSSQH